MPRHARQHHADRSGLIPPLPPNILIVIADDLHWHDMGCMDSEQVRTPNIDRLAKQRMGFDAAFTRTAMCAPTRQQLLTGLWPVRSGA
ncbi:MAG: sulfatase-like hydrolase/transferase [Planctomycetota bacterium]